jgi:hypothetical protein
MATRSGKRADCCGAAPCRPTLLLLHFSLPCLRQTTLQRRARRETQRRSRQELGPVDHARDYDHESLVVSFTRPGDRREAAAVAAAGRSPFSPSEKVVKPTETTSNFSPPDPTAPQADAPTQPLPAPAQRGRPCRQPRGPGPPLFNSSTDRYHPAAAAAKREPSRWRVATFTSSIR